MSTDCNSNEIMLNFVQSYGVRVFDVNFNISTFYYLFSLVKLFNDKKSDLFIVSSSRTLGKEAVSK